MPSLPERYHTIRSTSVKISEPLAIEDFVIQSMADVSPTKWHLAHTTWFFETFVLQPHSPGYKPLNETYAYLFNSYYVQAGARFIRDQRGLLSRPSVNEVMAYRAYVDEHMNQFLSTDRSTQILDVVEIGLNHEQQHQELMVTDIKHVLFANPLYPAYDSNPIPTSDRTPDLKWIPFEAGITTIGHQTDGFSYDNESPVHRQFLEPYALGSRPVANREVLEFIQDGGYSNPLLWLSEGWTLCQSEHWRHPLYWMEERGEWIEFTLHGRVPLDINAPATHLSYFEADAIARWMGLRLPTEFEWEHAARTKESVGQHFSDAFSFVPTFRNVDDRDAFVHLSGSAWEWTNSHYSPYPGYRPVDGALGEYNGKFMVNQFVLRGGSCATPSDHIRPTYRNFFPANARWQFSGLRLAKSI
jgi:ergothioneine biosynthesis protein EgtB